ALTLHYYAHPDGSVMDVSIDGQRITSVDTFSETVERRSITIDSYPDVPTLSMTQNIALSDTNHTLAFAMTDEANPGTTLWLDRAVATREDGTETVISTSEFDLTLGEWEPLRFNPVSNEWEPVVYNEAGNTWQIQSSQLPIPDSQVVHRATKREFPVYLQECCRALTVRSERLQNMPQSEFILLERQRGSHSEFTTDFIPFGLAGTLGLSDRYVVTGSVSHYVWVWNTTNFSEFFINSVIITFLTVFFQTLFAIMAAYAFASLKFPGRELIFTLFLVTLFVPFMVIITPNLITVTEISRWSETNIGPILDDIGEFTGTLPLIGRLNAKSATWIDNWPALVIPFWGSTFSIFLLRQFFMQIPKDLWDAARIDGAGHIIYLFRVVVPISRAAITTVVLFSFIGTWDQLEWPILVTNSEEWRPIAYALYNLRNEEGNDPQILMAGAMIALFPVILVYLIAQKQFTEGIATTGLKG
ncbi:MAG: carbohydrate ABC transporter permease, partial [Chloroflexi bacterium]|nr:carbohydrate ABC transporter permease [Chloroflexota bacterium]